METSEKTVFIVTSTREDGWHNRIEQVFSTEELAMEFIKREQRITTFLKNFNDASVHVPHFAIKALEIDCPPKPAQLNVSVCYIPDKDKWDCMGFVSRGHIILDIVSKGRTLDNRHYTYTIQVICDSDRVEDVRAAYEKGENIIKDYIKKEEQANG
jgi:hypothetical protein